MEKEMDLASLYVYYALSFTIKEFLTEYGDDFKAIDFGQLLFFVLLTRYEVSW
jgi:hypothetical protein